MTVPGRPVTVTTDCTPGVIVAGLTEMPEPRRGRGLGLGEPEAGVEALADALALGLGDPLVEALGDGLAGVPAATAATAATAGAVVVEDAQDGTVTGRRAARVAEDELHALGRLRGVVLQRRDRERGAVCRRDRS